MTTYSKTLKVFTPINIILLKNLSTILISYDHKLNSSECYYLDSEMVESDTIQMVCTPAQTHVGRFGITGCGTSYHTIKNDLSFFIENIYFKFV